MIQEGQLICDGCKAPISLIDKLSLQLLIEIVQDSPDRHYCEECSEEVPNRPPAVGKTRTASSPRGLRD